MTCGVQGNPSSRLAIALAVMIVFSPACSLADSIESRGVVKFRFTGTLPASVDREICDNAAFAGRQHNSNPRLGTSTAEMPAEGKPDAEQFAPRQRAAIESVRQGDTERLSF